MRRAAVLVAAAVLAAAGCGDGSVDGDEAASVGVRVVTVDAAAAILADPPDELVVLDVRTADEFGEGHLEGAVMLDFNDPGFSSELAALDREVPYVLYCRSGNRSEQARQMMADLGFVDVADIDGGISAWVDAGQPVVTG